MMYASFKLTIFVLCLSGISSEITKVTNEEPEKTDYLKRHSDTNEHQFGVEVTANKQFHHTKTFDDDVRLGCYGHIQDGVVHSTLYAADSHGYRIVAKREMIKVYPKFDTLRFASFDDIIASEEEKFTKNVFYVFPGACLSKNITLTTPAPFTFADIPTRVTQPVTPSSVSSFTSSGNSGSSGIKAPKVLSSGNIGNSVVTGKPSEVNSSIKPSGNGPKKPVATATVNLSGKPDAAAQTGSSNIPSKPSTVPSTGSSNFVITVPEPLNTGSIVPAGTRPPYNLVIGSGRSPNIEGNGSNKPSSLSNGNLISGPSDSSKLGNKNPSQSGNVNTLQDKPIYVPDSGSSATSNSANKPAVNPTNTQNTQYNLGPALQLTLNKPNKPAAANLLSNGPNTNNLGGGLAITSITSSKNTQSNPLLPRQQKQQSIGSGSCCDKLENSSFLHIPIKVKGSQSVDSCGGNSNAYIRLPVNLDFKDIIGDIKVDGNEHDVDMKSVLEKLLAKYK